MDFTVNTGANQKKNERRQAIKLLFAVFQRGGITLHSNFYNDGSWTRDSKVIKPATDDVVLCSCDSLVHNDAFRIFFLCKLP